MTEKYSRCSIIQHLINARCTRHAESPQLATQLRLLAICGRCSRGSAADVSSSSCRHCSRLFPGRFVVAFQIFAAVVVFDYTNFVYKFVFVFLFILVFVFVSFVLPFWRNKFKEITYFFLMNAVLSALWPMQGIGASLQGRIAFKCAQKLHRPEANRQKSKAFHRQSCFYIIRI